MAVDRTLCTIIYTVLQVGKPNYFYCPQMHSYIQSELTYTIVQYTVGQNHNHRIARYTHKIQPKHFPGCLIFCVQGFRSTYWLTINPDWAWPNKFLSAYISRKRCFLSLSPVRQSLTDRLEWTAFGSGVLHWHLHCQNVGLRVRSWTRVMI